MINQKNGMIVAVGSSEDPSPNSSMVVYGDSIYISYVDRITNQLKFSKSIDSGNTWQNKTVESAGKVVWTEFSMDIGSYGKKLMICFTDLHSGYLKIAKSYDQGVKWSIQSISSNKVSYSGLLRIDGSSAYICFTDYSKKNLKLALSNDNGHSWQTNIIYSNNGILVPNSIEANYRNIFITYQDHISEEFKIARSKDKGSSWVFNTIDKTVGSGNSSDIELMGDNVYITYDSKPICVDLEPTRGELRIAKSSDHGENFSIKTVAEHIYQSSFSTVKAFNKYVYVSFYEGFHGELVLARSTDMGNHFIYTSVDYNSKDVGAFTNLSLDNKFAYITYYDHTNKSLKFAKVNLITDF